MGQGWGTVNNCLGTLQTLVTTRTERRLREVRFYGFTPPPPPPAGRPVHADPGIKSSPELGKLYFTARSPAWHEWSPARSGGFSSPKTVETDEADRRDEDRSPTLKTSLLTRSQCNLPCNVV